ncbi:hypothetical protein F9288_02735 [Sphingomonas sp. CL5.1]|uniref:hypothetical protein n=1 Tax=Sphingomonas sp. CL5.1 TaxID=2653203 RepID=UPI0015837ED7|nr:hypothetical protein [Sphingomonas sp. CL5.1]QKR98681.1 hypothetical protein F9288_02735 [Sphingomonas sp. CL5.1]
MLAALLLAAAAPQSAVEAERAFAAMAQARGQWTAFRAFAADEATMFAPQPVNAQAFLKPLADPPRSLSWSPSLSYISCDGTTAANTGPWRGASGGHGYFSTIWRRQPDGGWKWIVDGGDSLPAPRAEVVEAKIRKAACGRPRNPPEPPLGVERKVGAGASPDKTLVWWYEVARDGARAFAVRLWNGRAYDAVIDDRIAAPTR